MFVIYNLEKKKENINLGRQDSEERTCIAPAVRTSQPNNVILTRGRRESIPGKRKSA